MKRRSPYQTCEQKWVDFRELAAIDSGDGSKPIFEFRNLSFNWPLIAEYTSFRFISGCTDGKVLADKVSVFFWWW